MNEHSRTGEFGSQYSLSQFTAVSLCGVKVYKPEIHCFVH